MCAVSYRKLTTELREYSAYLTCILIKNIAVSRITQWQQSNGAPENLLQVHRIQDMQIPSVQFPYERPSLHNPQQLGLPLSAKANRCQIREQKLF